LTPSRRAADNHWSAGFGRHYRNVRHKDDSRRRATSRPEPRLSIAFGSITAGHDMPDNDFDLAVTGMNYLSISQPRGS
jgi:hypothetical protein